MSSVFTSNAPTGQGVGSGIGAGLSLGGIGSGIGTGIGAGIGAGIGGSSSANQDLHNTDSQGHLVGGDSGEDGEEYIPTQKEVEGYAEFLGMDPEVDKEFLYIAIEGLKAPVPHPW